MYKIYNFIQHIHVKIYFKLNSIYCTMKINNINF